jgi:hypothetical protein
MIEPPKSPKITKMANKLAISSISISQYPGHLLDHKIRAAANGGFAGIEIVYNDLETYGKSQNVPIQTAAKQILKLCQPPWINASPSQSIGWRSLVS